jgi:hypothetical protein
MMRQIKFFWVLFAAVVSLTNYFVVGRRLRQADFAPAVEIITDTDPRSYAGYQSSSWALPLDFYEISFPANEPSVE